MSFRFDPNPHSSFVFNTIIYFTNSRMSSIIIISKLLRALAASLRLVLSPLRKVCNILFPLGKFDGLNSPGTADMAAKAFGKYFVNTFIVPLNDKKLQSNNTSEDEFNLWESPFVEKGYMNVVSSIANQASLFESIEPDVALLNPDQTHNNNNDILPISPPPPLLLIYLHSPLNSQCSSFLEGIICNKRILSFLGRNMKDQSLTCWGGSIHSAEGSHVMQMFKVYSFPFLALVQVKPLSGSRNSTSSANRLNNANSSISMEMHLRLEGNTLLTTTVSKLHAYLNSSLQRHQKKLNESLSLRLQRRQEKDLRKEQDMEYQTALEEDQRREREKCEKLERIRLEKEMLEKVEEDERKKKEGKLEKAKALIGEEPSNSEKDTVRIRFMMPSGKRMEHRFRSGDRVDTLYAYLFIYFHENKLSMKNFSLNCTFPRKSLKDEAGMTLKEEGLCPQAVIMVQDLDA